MTGRNLGADTAEANSKQENANSEQDLCGNTSRKYVKKGPQFQFHMPEGTPAFLGTLVRVSYFPIIVGQLVISVSGESGFSVFTRKRPSGATSYWNRTKVGPTMWVWNSTRGVPAVFFTGSNVVLINFLSGPM